MLVLTLRPVTDADGICASQTPAGAGNLTIAGALAASGAVSLDTPQKVTITGGSDESGKTFTITGTNWWGATISEALAGPNAGTVTTTLDFKTITQVAVSAATLGAVTVGVDGTLDSIPVPLKYSGDFNVGFSVNISGTCTYDVEYTHDFEVWTNHASVAAKSADADGTITSPVAAIRVAVTAFTSGKIDLHVSR